MLAKNEVAKIYETILSIPGMTDDIKVPFKTSRKNVLLLSKVIERGLNSSEMDEESVGVLEIVSKETREELSQIAAQLLNMAGLSEMNERLKAL